MFITVVPFMERGASPTAGQNKWAAAGNPSSLMQIILGKPQCEAFGWSHDRPYNVGVGLGLAWLADFGKGTGAVLYSFGD
jgi:hypothetical protein